MITAILASAALTTAKPPNPYAGWQIIPIQGQTGRHLVICIPGEYTLKKVAGTNQVRTYIDKIGDRLVVSSSQAMLTYNNFQGTFPNNVMVFSATAPAWTRYSIGPWLFLRLGGQTAGPNVTTSAEAQIIAVSGIGDGFSLEYDGKQNIKEVLRTIDLIGRWIAAHNKPR
jgi:hypothetical protein